MKAKSTSSGIDGFEFEVPSLVLQTAAVPLSPNGSIEITWSASDKSTSYFVGLHFAEIQVLQNNSLREFYIYANGELVFKDAVPLDYLTTSYAYYTRNGYTDYNMSLVSSARATLPPIINAFELYTVVPVTFLPTDNGDASLRESIKKMHVFCRTLSSSGLNGTIISDFGSLIALERLDLSHNYLSGNIPDSLDQLTLLTYLDLSGNSGLSKTLPPGLQKKQNDRHLTVIFSSVDDGTGHKKSSNAVIIIIVAVVIVFLIVGATALFFWYLKKKKKNTRINPPTGPESSSHVDGNPIKGSAIPEAGKIELNFNKKRFNFAELKHVTNNFRDLIGVGGFGEVFKGHTEGRLEVAVKLRSESSSQGIQQFLNEVEKLSRVHHKNLVSLIGYCEEGNQIALVYEYMQKGNLQDWIRGSAPSLPWKQRLRIAYESAQGLEYLHKMCNPPLIHRDIKTSNILLSTNLEAKVSDFGLVRDCNGPHVTTKVVGTPGYLDPYYASTSQLTEKSDMFSFGVILLELITGKSPIIQGPQGGQHLTQFVQQRLSKGKIESIVDPNMGSQYNINSIWKVADMALRCTNHPANRPDMTRIVTELKEALKLEMSSMESSSVASEDISQYSGYSRNDFPAGGEVHSGNFEMARMGGLPLPDYGPIAR
ncbi:hypothetical protein LUZ63_013647 [Rhynchospora breviuscula]|uniref:non-specific serine/threonine protein kinase n=1 Tax=Rhynchospora breviuscula TaxID=2022672 RepID=A0A9Q0C8Y7_9POAL|nr:hypothetical protein LUZ63_013647 [Rhynchospora breviuscula]